MNLPMIQDEKGRVCGQRDNDGVKEGIKQIIRRACGAMETRQTTNLKIAGSTPARLVFLIKVIRSMEAEVKGSGTHRHVCTSRTRIRVWHREYEYGDISCDSDSDS